MNARGQRASGRQIGRTQAPPTAGRAARTVQEAITTGEAISIGAANLLRNTVLAALSGARDVGVKAGSVAAAAARGSIVAATEIGDGLGRVSERLLNGTFGAAREIGSDLMNLMNAKGAKQPLAKATSGRRRRASDRERTRRSA